MYGVNCDSEISSQTNEFGDIMREIPANMKDARLILVELSIDRTIFRWSEVAALRFSLK